MAPRVLLVNPPVCDFSAYDFWLKPYGLLRVGGWLRGQAELRLFDFLDRFDSRVPRGTGILPVSGRAFQAMKHGLEAHATHGLEGRATRKLKSDVWGRGEIFSVPAEKPAHFADVPRRYHRFGLPGTEFQKFLQTERPFDFVLIQSSMTYWYPGIKEVLADIRTFCPQAKVILGGVYATLCQAHAKTLGADLVIAGNNLQPLWELANLSPRLEELPFWEGYGTLKTGVLKLTEGCPFKCTYCATPLLNQNFQARPWERSLAEAKQLAQRGVQDIAFYDDALLYKSEEILLPFLNELQKQKISVHFHTPNALHARFINKELAQTMVAAGFKIIYLGFESSAGEWQAATGSKVQADDLARAVENLLQAGAQPQHLCAYLVMGHPQGKQQELESSLHCVHSLGIRVMLAEFSPIPHTPDGELCRHLADLDEPLNHNKTFFAIRSLGAAEVSRLKQLCRDLNQEL